MFAVRIREWRVCYSRHMPWARTQSDGHSQAQRGDAAFSDHGRHHHADLKIIFSLRNPHAPLSLDRRPDPLRLIPKQRPACSSPPCVTLLTGPLCTVSCSQLADFEPFSSCVSYHSSLSCHVTSTRPVSSSICLCSCHSENSLATAGHRAAPSCSAPDTQTLGLSSSTAFLIILPQPHRSSPSSQPSGPRSLSDCPPLPLHLSLPLFLICVSLLFSLHLPSC